MKPGAVPVLLALLPWFTSTTHALPRTSADYNLTPESLNGGGRRTTSAHYSNEGALGEMGSLATTAAPAVAVMSGYISALETVGILPTLTTSPATGTTANGTTVGGEVTNDGGSEVITRGIVHGTDSDPTVEADTVVAAAPGSGPYHLPLSGLSPGTTYHVRAFATTMVGTGYGANLYFTTDTNVAFTDGLAGFSRTMLAGDRHVFAFTVTGSRLVSFTATGGANLRARLFNGQGDLIADFDGDGDFTFEQLLLAGAYTLRVYREPGIGAGQAFDLAIDASVVAATRPDVAVGASPGGLRGVDAFAPSPQTVTLTSRRANPVTGHASIANRGTLPDLLAVNATRGSGLFKAVYLGPAGNITAGLTSGAYRTPAMDEGDAPIAIRATVTPNKWKLTRKSGRRSVVLRKNFTATIAARASSDAGLNDSGSIKVQTR